jgi:acyl-homoserine lactone acylase PvdQ
MDAHTSTNVDVADMYAEKIVTKNKLFYEYNSELLPVIEKLITVKYLQKEN